MDKIAYMIGVLLLIVGVILNVEVVEPTDTVLATYTPNNNYEMCITRTR